MLKAYETDGGRGIYWQVFQWCEGDTTHLADVETLADVITMARDKKVPVSLYTQEWAELFEQELEEKGEICLICCDKKDENGLVVCSHCNEKAGA